MGQVHCKGNTVPLGTHTWTHWPLKQLEMNRGIYMCVVWGSVCVRESERQRERVCVYLEREVVRGRSLVGYVADVVV
jgi:hypothetical protein